MKFAHISDLHLGIELNDFSLQEDQKYILKQIVNIAEEEKVEGIFIAGDVYDRGIAPVEAITLFNSFLAELAAKKIKVFVISGNHDSAERIAPGRQFMTGSNIYFSNVYDGKINHIKLNDKNGDVNVYLMPFVRPGLVRHFAEEAGDEVSVEENPWNNSIEYVIKNMKIDKSERNILVAHQNIVNAEKSDSETIIYGGLDGISAELFKDFDYTALGHIHKPQNVEKNVRYCGTPLKYSLSEKDQEKSVTIIDLGKKGEVEVSCRNLVPLRDMRQIEGTYVEIARDFEKTKLNKNDFIYAILKDESEIPDVMSKLRGMYPNTFGFRYENSSTKNLKKIEEISLSEKHSPLENFEEFFSNRSGLPLNEEERKYVSEVIYSIWGEN